MVTGSEIDEDSIAIGGDAGSAIGPVGSANIMIGHTGAFFDAATIRIGTPGTQARSLPPA